MPKNPMYGQNKEDNKIDLQITDQRTYRFGAPPIVIDADSTVADGVDTNIIEHVYSDGLHLAVSNTGTQTILIPAASTSGMDYAYDQEANDGVQWVMSQNTHKGNTEGSYIDRFTVNNGYGFFASLKFSIADVSGTDDFHFGFRKVEAFQAAYDNYDEAVDLAIITSADPALIQVSEILNGAATSETSTTDTLADGVTTTWRVNVSSAGVVTFTIDGAAPTTTSAFTFDAGEVVTPFLYQIHATDLAGAIILQELIVGKNQ